MGFLKTRGEQVLLKVTYSELANLFKVSTHTVKKWTYLGKLDPSNLLDIIEKYNNSSMLDRRRKE